MAAVMRYFRLEKSDDPVPGLLRVVGSKVEIEKGLDAFRVTYDGVIEIGAKEAAKIRRRQLAAEMQQAGDDGEVDELSAKVAEESDGN